MKLTCLYIQNTAIKLNNTIQRSIHWNTVSHFISSSWKLNYRIFPFYICALHYCPWHGRPYQIRFYITACFDCIFSVFNVIICKLWSGTEPSAKKMGQSPPRENYSLIEWFSNDVFGPLKIFRLPIPISYCWFSVLNFRLLACFIF